jgi:3-oxoadipate enol-lactonase/4-carboxymuconolactone decarboxylase
MEMAEAGPPMEGTRYDLAGPEDAPLLVLLGSLGTDKDVWEGQVPAFSNWFRVLRVEHPGHDRGSAPKGPYTVAGLGRRVMALIDALSVGRASFAGLSLGGLIAMWLAAEYPERVERLAVCGSAPRFEPSSMWVGRAQQVRAEGTAPLADAAMGRWFTPTFLSRQPEVVRRFRATFCAVDPEGYASCCDALAVGDVSSRLGRIQAPTLVLAGADDPVVPPESAAATMKAIPGSSLTVLAGAAHLPNVEQRDAFNSVVLDHLAGRQIERGSAQRRAVLGEAYVDRALAGVTELTAPFQDFLVRWPWGEVWARPGLERETRRLVAIAILVALGRHDELELHLRAALRDGLSTTVLGEVLLQTAVYAGVPAANSAFAIANRVWAEDGRHESGNEAGS